MWYLIPIGLTAMALALMYIAGDMGAVARCDKNKFEMLAHALEVGRRNGLAACKSEFHPMMEQAARDREARHCELAFVRGTKRGHDECEATHAPVQLGRAANGWFMSTKEIKK